MNKEINKAVEKFFYQLGHKKGSEEEDKLMDKINGYKDEYYGIWKTDLIRFTEKLLSQQKEEIGKDLLKIADKGQIEDLRREVVEYFGL